MSDDRAYDEGTYDGDRWDILEIPSVGSRHFRAIQFYFKTKVTPVKEE
jgi:hypothetical protein